MAQRSSTAFTNDFSDYPSGTIRCLNNASNNSGCTGTTSVEMNACLCSNGASFVTDSAECIAQQDPGDMTSTWEILQMHCSASNNPLDISLSAWMAMASDVTTSTTVSPTSSSDTNTDDDGRCSLSSNAKVGLIAGSLGVGLLLLITVVFFCLRCRRRRHQDDDVRYTQLGNSGRPGISMVSSEVDDPSTMGMRIPTIADTRRHPINTSCAAWSPRAFDRATFAHTSDFYRPQALEFVHEMPSRKLHGPLSPFSTEPAAPTEMPTAAYRHENVHSNS